MKILRVIVSLLVFLGGLAALKAPHVAHLRPYSLVYPSSFGSRFTIPENNPLTEEGVALGRMLFYEPLLSKTNTVSCSSCHQQSLAFSDNRRLSIGVSGKPTRRNSMSLANLLWVKNLFWDGRVSGLEAQAAFPLTHPHEMGQSLEISAKNSQRRGFILPYSRRYLEGRRLRAIKSPKHCLNLSAHSSPPIRLMTATWRASINSRLPKSEA